jgi:hypothetical protein
MSGWMGRYLDHAGTMDNPLQGLSLDYQLQPSLASTKVPVASIATPEDYSFYAPGVWGTVEERMLDSLASIGARRRDPFLNQAAAATAQSDRLRRQLAPFAQNNGNGYGSPVAYPEGEFPHPAGPRGHARRRTSVALRGGLGAGRIRHLRAAPGACRGARHHVPEPLRIPARPRRRGLAGRVLTLVWTEFGRRAERTAATAPTTELPGWRS